MRTLSHPSDHMRGISLLGVLVATFLLLGVGVAVARLLAHNENSFGIAQEKMVAATLAREGLELVQATRDSNWLAESPTNCGGAAPDGRDSCWVVGICGPAGIVSATDYQFTVDYDPAAGTIIVPFTGSEQDQLFIDTTTSLWTHVATAQATPYRRVISVDCSARAADPPVVTVRATVRWDSRGRAQDVVVQEQLYNWYKP